MDISKEKEKRFREIRQILLQYNKDYRAGKNPDEPIINKQEFTEYCWWGEERMANYRKTGERP